MSSHTNNNSSASFIARRQHGVCTGHLWRHDVENSPKKSPEKAKKEFVYCVLVGVTLSTYADRNAYLRGDHAMSLVRIVGASAWNDHSTKETTTKQAAADTSFRIMTSNGTQMYCTAPTSMDRNVWLASLHAGLEASFASPQGETLPPFLPPSPRVRGSKRNYCKSCGKLAYQIVLEGAPLPQYGVEGKCQVCPLCSLAQGVVLDVQRINNIYQQQVYEKETLEKAKKQCWNVVEQAPNEEAATEKLLLLISSPEFGTFRRVSPTLGQTCTLLETSQYAPSEFLESFSASKEESQQCEYKKQAFRVAGAMGAAIQLLQNCCSDDNESQEMLSYILELFLDLCQEGELSSVAFFWPQLQCIHLRMLPPENALQLQKVELFEDFLLTVATKYSIQLALELVWGYSADLEDAIYNTACLPECRRRRFSVLRFVCELESLLFDFEHGWGGGSVALKNMIQPSPHQVTLLRLSMLQLQDFRHLQGAFLSQSVRRDKLQNSKFNLPPEEAAQEALRIARNADYFSSHLSYIRRLGDVAEKLRHLPLEQRAPTLERELSLLNSSGGMGGDPLNRITENLIRVVRVPQTEGHVFRSKERTPVLLLMEVLEEGVVEDDRSTPASSPEKTLDNAKDSSEVYAEVEFEVEQVDEEAAKNEEESGSSSKQTKGEGTGEAEPEKNDGSGDSSSDESGEYVTAHGPTNDEPDSGGNGKSKVNSEGGDLKSEQGRGDGKVETKGDGDELEGDGDAKSTTKEGDDEDKDIYSDPLKSLDAELTDPTHHSPRVLVKLKHFGDTPKPDPPGATPSKKKVEEMIGQLDMPSLHPNAVDEADAEEGDDEHDDSAKGDDDRSRISRLSSTRMSAFGSSDVGDSMSSLPGDEIRREVLTTIMMKGKRGANAIASVSALAAQKSLQDLDRKRAVDMILHGDEEEDTSPRYIPPGSERRFEETEAARRKLLELGLDQAAIAETLEEEPIIVRPSEEDEAMEALRLLLLQNRVGQGTMSAESAAMAMAAQPTASSVINVSGLRSDRPGKIDKSEMIEIDAGDVDPRLSGCGSLPPAVLSALTLWKAEVVSTGELLELVKKDLDYIRLIDEDNADKLIENSQFWGRFAYGERWAEKKARIAASSPDGTDIGWDLVGVIVKSNDDLRQEAFVMQLIELCDEAFQLAGLELWLHPYRILATGRTTGVIEMVKNAMSFDALKKRPGYGRGGLREHLKRMTEYTADPGESFRCAQRNFVSSLAAYSLLSYFFLFKDRHNGNILLDTVGHVIHIDFGFVFGVAPGGSFSLEMSTPFKLTEEMMEVMGGMESPLFSEFVTLFCCGFLALQAHADTFATVVEITCRGSSFKCFEGRDADEVVAKLRERFVPDFSKESTVAYALDLIKQATKSYGTKQYDYFQYLSQGIAA